MTLPASPAANRREREVREAARAAAFDQGYAQGRAYANAIMGEGAAQAAPTIPARPAGSPTHSLALDIGQDRIFLPEAVPIERRLTEDGEEIATSIRVGRLTFTIEEAVRLGVLTTDGRFSHYRAGVLLHSTPEPGAWVRPHREAEIPGRPRA